MARASSLMATAAATSISVIAGANNQVLRYRADRTGAWQDLPGAFLHVGPPVEVMNEQGEIISGPENAVLFVPYTSAQLRVGPGPSTAQGSGQVIDQDGFIWAAMGAMPGVAFRKYRMARKILADMGQVAGRI